MTLLKKGSLPLVLRLGGCIDCRWREPEPGPRSGRTRWDLAASLVLRRQWGMNPGAPANLISF